MSEWESIGSRSDELVVNSRATSGPVQALNGQSLTAGLPTQNPDANLIGQFESLEAGILKGWACVKGQKSANLQVGKSDFPLPKNKAYKPCIVEIHLVLICYHKVIS